MAVVSRPPEMPPAVPGVDALLVTPGPDLFYLTGYHAIAARAAHLPGGPRRRVIPSWSRRGSRFRPHRRPRSARLGRPDPWLGRDRRPLRTGRLPGARTPGRVAVADSMAAAAVLRLRDAMPAGRAAAGRAGAARAADAQGRGRGRRTCGAAGAAIDRVHEQVADLLRPGRTEREVGDGHRRGDPGGRPRDASTSSSSASGPNGASPHHERVRPA